MTAPPDDASIRDEADLWRRIPPWHCIYDENLGRWRPSSSAFAADPDGHPWRARHGGKRLHKDCAAARPAVW
jgi:hypothetical protein